MFWWISGYILRGKSRKILESLRHKSKCLEEHESKSFKMVCTCVKTGYLINSYGI